MGGLQSTADQNRANPKDMCNPNFCGGPNQFLSCKILAGAPKNKQNLSNILLRFFSEIMTCSARLFCVFFHLFSISAKFSRLLSIPRGLLFIAVRNCSEAHQTTRVSVDSSWVIIFEKMLFCINLNKTNGPTTYIQPKMAQTLWPI